MNPFISSLLYNFKPLFLTEELASLHGSTRLQVRLPFLHMISTYGQSYLPHFLTIEKLSLNIMSSDNSPLTSHSFLHIVLIYQ